MLYISLQNEYNADDIFSCFTNHNQLYASSYKWIVYMYNYENKTKIYKSMWVQVTKNYTV